MILYSIHLDTPFLQGHIQEIVRGVGGLKPTWKPYIQIIQGGRAPIAPLHPSPVYVLHINRLGKNRLL